MRVFTGKKDYLSRAFDALNPQSWLFLANFAERFPTRKTGNSAHRNREITGRKQPTDKWQAGIGSSAASDSADLPALACFELLLVTQFGHEHEERESFSLPKYLFGPCFHSPVVELT